MSNGAAVGDLLEQCAVLVQVLGKHEGSGFFAAPGVVVTCYHVVAPTGALVGPEQITVVTSGGDSLAVQKLRQFSQDCDLAVLVLEGIPLDRAVLLDHEYQIGEDLYTFGFPETHPEGVPTTLKAEGPTGGPTPEYKFKDGQVMPGMSGSPLLNLRTGAVCGVLTRTRNETQALGGYAVTVTTLFQVDVELARENQAFHKKRSEWLDRLEPARRQLMRASWGGFVSDELKVTHFVASISETPGGWQVQAATYPDADPMLAVSVDLNAVRMQVARLFRDWALRGRVEQDEQIRLLGGILYSAVFPGEIGERLSGMLSERDRRVAVAVRFEQGVAEDLMHLPWEHLYLERGEVYLAMHERSWLTRSLAGEPKDQDQPDPDHRLRVLVVMVRPDGDDPDQDRILARDIKDVAGDMEDTIGRTVDVTVIDAPTPTELEEHVGEEQWDVVHYVGFGHFELRGTDKLALGAGPRRIKFVDSRMFASCVQARPPKLVVLQLVEGAPETTVPADVTLFAPSLLAQGAAAAIAFQYPLNLELATNFNQNLYGELVKGKPVEAAIQVARKKLKLADSQSRAFVSPALFVAEPGEHRLVRPPTDQGYVRKPSVSRSMAPALLG